MVLLIVIFYSVEFVGKLGGEVYNQKLFQEGNAVQSQAPSVCGFRREEASAACLVVEVVVVGDGQDDSCGKVTALCANQESLTQLL